MNEASNLDSLYKFYNTDNLPRQERKEILKVALSRRNRVQEFIEFINIINTHPGNGPFYAFRKIFTTLRDSFSFVKRCHPDFYTDAKALKRSVLVERILKICETRKKILIEKQNKKRDQNWFWSNQSTASDSEAVTSNAEEDSFSDTESSSSDSSTNMAGSTAKAKPSRLLDPNLYDDIVIFFKNFERWTKLHGIEDGDLMNMVLLTLSTHNDWGRIGDDIVLEDDKITFENFKKSLVSQVKPGDSEAHDALSDLFVTKQTDPSLDGLIAFHRKILQVKSSTNCKDIPEKVFVNCFISNKLKISSTAESQLNC